jgi:hypothetical protein
VDRGQAGTRRRDFNLVVGGAMRELWLLCTLLAAAVCQAGELYQWPSGERSAVSSFENLNGSAGQGGRSNQSAKGNAFESLKAGESKTLLDVRGAGIIQRMWFTVRERSPEMLRALRLRIYWDDAAKPAVDVPFGDFFALGLARTTAFESALFSSPEGRSFNSYVPMPFRKSARVVLSNEGNEDQPLLFFDIDFVRLRRPPPDMLYFHAYWSRQKTSALGADFELLPRVTGKGRFLGASIGIIADPLYADSWFGEGEVKMYIDDDRGHPSINGTGSEDYIGTGWGMGTFAHRYQGCTVADQAKRQYAMYRFHLPDVVVFAKGFRATIQQIGGAELTQVRALQKNGARLQAISVATDSGFIRLLELPRPPALQDADFPEGWVNFFRVDDYSATSYFYLDRPSSDLPSLPGIDHRVR